MAQNERIYEGMFLVDAGFASNFQRVEETISRLMDRAQAKLLYCKKWDERRLAYDIAGKRRGVYVLTFFTSVGDSTASLERDVQLTDGLIRALVLRREKLTIEKVKELAEGPGIVPVRVGPDFGGPPWRSGRDSDRRRRDGAPPVGEGRRQGAPRARFARPDESTDTRDRPKPDETDVKTAVKETDAGDADQEEVSSEEWT